MVKTVSSLGLAAFVFGILTRAQDTKPPLFTYEINTLTDETLVGLISSNNISTSAALFAFDDPAVSTADRLKSGTCKVFPGDANWPSKSVWSDFNKLLGGQLIETVPLAAPCYQNLGVLDAEKCAGIQKNWADPYLQYGWITVLIEEPNANLMTV